jgi:hypothetical protein
MKPLFTQKLQLSSPSSLRVRSLSFLGAYRLRNTNEIPLRRSKSLQADTKSCEATKQSSFTNQTTRTFRKIYQKLFTANSGQGDCFVNSLTIGLVKFDFPSELRLAMTTKCCGATKCSAYGLNSDYRLLTIFFKG